MATIVPCPTISRGTDATVPMPPGLVERDVAAGEVVGAERVGAGLLDERVVRVEELLEAQAAGVRITGTISVRVPSFFSTSTARPRLTPPSSTRYGVAAGLDEVVGHDRHLVGRGLGDRVGDQVREGDLLAASLNCLRRASSVGDGSVRNEVAVGIERLSSM